MVREYATTMKMTYIKVNLEMDYVREKGK